MKEEVSYQNHDIGAECCDIEDAGVVSDYYEETSDDEDLDNIGRSFHISRTNVQITSLDVNDSTHILDSNICHTSTKALVLTIDFNKFGIVNQFIEAMFEYTKMFLTSHLVNPYIKTSSRHIRTELQG